MIYLTIKDKIQLFFSGNLGKVGSIVFVSTFLFWSVFASLADFNSMFFWFEKLDNTSGRIDDWFETNTYINDQLVIGYNYSFEIDGLPYSGTAYEYSSYYDINDSVQIEYAIGDPNISRIMGGMTGTMPLFVVLIIGIFPLIGFIVLILALKQTSQNIATIMHGDIVKGELIDSSPTNTKINNRTLYRLTYKYLAGGSEYENITKSVNPYDFGNQEDVIFNSLKPGNSVLFRKLPTLIANKLNHLR